MKFQKLLCKLESPAVVFKGFYVGFEELETLVVS